MPGIENCKLLIIGLDGASFDLLDPWFEKGELPTLHRLKTEGYSAPLQSVPNLHSAAAWTSMVTGKNPGKHGIYFFVERDKNFSYKFFNGGDKKSTSIWNILNEKGWKTGTVNVPMTFPAEPVNGIMISGLDSPSTKDRRSIHPSRLIDDYPLLKEKYDIIPPVQDLLKKDRPDKAVRKWFEIISSRTELSKSIFKDYDFDFFMITFIASDWANHNLWKYQDPSYPHYDDNKSKKFGRLMLDIYKKLDEAIAEFLSLVGSQTNVFIVSDHGAGKHQLGSFYLTDWLIRNRFTSLENQPLGKSFSQRVIHSSVSFAQKFTPYSCREALKKKFPKLGKLWREQRREQLGQHIFNSIDWTKTKAYTELKAHNIWINLKGREKNGIVNPGQEYNDICEEMKGRLSEWKDRTTHQQVVKKVLHRSEIYHGPYSDRAPDLQIWWNDDVVLSPGKKSPFSEKIQTQIEEGWSGDHRLNGIFIGWGPRIKKGASKEPLSIYDVTPTALHLFDISSEEDFDGRIVEEALRD